MKTKTILAIIMLFVPVLSAETTTMEDALVDDAPVGFIHLRKVENKKADKNDNYIDDHYVKTTIITGISISQSTEEKEMVFGLAVVTQALRGNYSGNGDYGDFGQVRYFLKFRLKEDADKAARRIMELVRNAEHPDSAPPASNTGVKLPAKDQPPTPTSKNSPE